MKLLLLGTAGYHPSETRHTACLMLPEVGIVLDAGTGFFRVRDHLETETLDILLTHAHLDHVAGLTFLLDTAWERNLTRITVHGEAEKLAVVREHLLHDLLFPAPLNCEWRPLGEQPLLLGGFKVTHFPLAHPGGCVGYRLDGPGRSLAYVTDTTATVDARYIEAIRGVDLLIHECNFRDSEHEWAVKTGHSSTSLVAGVAARAGAGRLVLIHLNPLNSAADPVDLAVARQIFANTELGHDGMELQL